MKHIATKLLIAYACIIAVSFLLMALPLHVLTRKNYTARAMERFAKVLSSKQNELERASRKQDRIAMDLLCDEINTEFSGRVSLLAQDGSVTADSISARCIARARPECIPNIRRRREKAMSQYMPLDDTLTIRLPLKLGAEPMTARLALPLKPLQAQMRGVNSLLTLAGLAGIALAITVGHVLSRRIASPIENMTAMAERIAEGDFSCNVPRTGNDEVARLANALTQMQASLRSTIADLKTERDQAVAIVSNMSDGLLALDAEKRIVFTNSMARSRFPRLPKETGTMCSDTSLPEPLSSAVTSTMTEGTCQTVEVGDVQTDGHVLRATVTPTRGEGNLPPHGAVIVLTDITEAKRTQNLGRELVANASHELRTPITIATSAADALEDEAVNGTLPDQCADFVDIISRQLQRMEALVAETLQLSRLDAGTLADEMLNVDLCTIVQDVYAASAEHAVSKNIKLTYNLPDHDIVVLGVERLLAMALTNLVDNAIRYIGDGDCIRVQVGEDDMKMRKITVTDNGPGIPKHEQDRIFERFVRGSQSSAGGAVGSGLGLAIVNRVAELHRGSVELDSNAENGCTFTISLPPPE